MAKVKVPLFGNSAAKYALLERDATVGAQIGVNLLLPDGTLPSLADLQKLFGVTPGDNVSISTTDDLDEGQWNLWFTDRRAQDAVGSILADSDTIGLTYVAGTSITGTLKDLADSGEGTLQAITVDAKGRVSGTRDATINGTDGHIAVTNGNASAAPPIIDLDAGFVALIDFLQALAPNPRVTSDNSYRVTSDGAYRVTA